MLRLILRAPDIFLQMQSFSFKIEVNFCLKPFVCPDRKLIWPHPNKLKHSNKFLLISLVCGVCSWTFPSSLGLSQTPVITELQ